MDVDPVVGERIVAVDHEQHRQEFAVAQAAGRVAHLHRRLGLGDPDGGAQRQRGDHVRGVQRLAAGHDLGDAPVGDLELGDGRVEPHLAALLADVGGHLLPHLPGPEPGVVELRDQRLDLVALVAEERGLGGGEERQALDPLGGPLGADLVRRDAPQLLGVGLEEVLVEPLAEAVGDPGLERVLATLGLGRRPHVGDQAARQLHRAELLDHVHALQRILEELVVPVDPALARALEELLLHDLVPEVVDLLDLGEEAVAAEIEAVAVPDLGARDAADEFSGLEHDHRLALLDQLVAGGQARRSRAEDDDGMFGRDVGPERGAVCRCGVGHRLVLRRPSRRALRCWPHSRRFGSCGAPRQPA